MGSREIAYEQMKRLMIHVRSPRIIIQIVPFASPSDPAAGLMSILDLNDGGQLVHLDGPVSGTTTAQRHIIKACVEKFEMLRSQAASVPDSEGMIQDRLNELR